jgi:hypothetical protein
MIKLHGVFEYRFVAPGDVRPEDGLVRPEEAEAAAEMIQLTLDNLRAQGNASRDDLERAEGRTRSPERTLCVKRGVV